MKKQILRLILFLSFIFSPGIVSSATHASNFTINNLTCTSLQLNWTPGTGKGRIIIGTEGASAPGFTPTNNVLYTAFSYFNFKGKSATEYAPGVCFIVYNATGSNSVKIDSLKPCTTYSFTIYEHDNNGSSTIYDMTSAANTSGTTYCLNLKFDLKIIDSCQAKNKFEFTSKSSSTIPGVSYTWVFGDGKTSPASPSTPETHSYDTSGYIYARITSSPNKGCTNIYEQKLRIYAKKVAYIDFSKFINPQCLNGNYFEIDPVPIVSPIPKSITYMWNFGDGSGPSTFKKMKKTYAKSGKYRVELELITNVNLSPTACRDTLRFDLDVLQPAPQLSVSDSILCLKNNSFSFYNKEIGTGTYAWDFGDGFTANTRNATHSYNKTGTFIVKHTNTEGPGCAGTANIKVVVLPSLNTSFTGLDTAYCASNNKITLVPASGQGKFSGYPVVNNILIPNLPGNYTLKNKVKSTYCSDSLSRNFVIHAIPVPDLYIPDTILCLKNNSFFFSNNDQTMVSYSWKLGDGNSGNTRNVTHSYTDTGTYITSHSMTDKYGCIANDTFPIYVLPSLITDFTGLDSVYCASKTKVTLIPALAHGNFFGYPVKNNILVPDKPGNYTLLYKIFTTNCSDSNSANFIINPSPTVYLGRDTILNKNQTLTLDAGISPKYLWSTGDTGRTITIDANQGAEGTRKYIVTNTNSYGCSGKDSILVTIDRNSSLNDPRNSFLKIYPNPVTDILTISGPDHIEFEWAMYNETGQRIMSGDSKMARLDLSGERVGIYFLEIKTSERISTLKIVKL